MELLVNDNVKYNLIFINKFDIYLNQGLEAVKSLVIVI